MTNLQEGHDPSMTSSQHPGPSLHHCENYAISLFPKQEKIILPFLIFQSVNVMNFLVKTQPKTARYSIQKDFGESKMLLLGRDIRGEQMCQAEKKKDIGQTLQQIIT